ncbi:hypothetical protein FOCC_FOCC008784, partial [Frankliniella occidentalis]
PCGRVAKQDTARAVRLHLPEAHVRHHVAGAPHLGGGADGAAGDQQGRPPAAHAGVRVWRAAAATQWLAQPGRRPAALRLVALPGLGADDPGGAAAGRDHADGRPRHRHPGAQPDGHAAPQQEDQAGPAAARGAGAGQRPQHPGPQRAARGRARRAHHHLEAPAARPGQRQRVLPGQLLGLHGGEGAARDRVHQEVDPEAQGGREQQGDARDHAVHLVPGRAVPRARQPADGVRARGAEHPLRLPGLGRPHALRLHHQGPPQQLALLSRVLRRVHGPGHRGHHDAGPGLRGGLPDGAQGAAARQAARSLHVHLGAADDGRSRGRRVTDDQQGGRDERREQWFDARALQVVRGAPRREHAQAGPHGGRVGDRVKSRVYILVQLVVTFYLVSR